MFSFFFSLNQCSLFVKEERLIRDADHERAWAWSRSFFDPLMSGSKNAPLMSAFRS